jgi:putative FmdB family regulatory protein
MPLYEYECVTNGHRFERIQKFSDPPVAVCPTCGSEVRKLLSSPAIQFKGSGWYITDYARQGSQDKKSGSADSSSTKGESKTSEAKGDASGAATKSEASDSKPAAAPAKTK